MLRVADSAATVIALMTLLIFTIKLVSAKAMIVLGSLTRPRPSSLRWRDS